MALVRRRLTRRVIGIDRDPAARRLARARRACHEVSGDIEAARGADLVVLAVPVRQIIALAPRVAPLLAPGGILTDTGSTKSAVCRVLHGIGGHPMCGTERSGIAAADPRLFEGVPWVLVPGDRTSLRRVAALVRALGAHPVTMTAAAHDRAAALASHLPYALALALSRLAGPRPPLAAGSFRSATRVAAQPAEMGLDILLTNRFHIARAAGRMAGVLASLASALRRGDEAAVRRFVGEGKR